ncbi:hypothetical protein FY004_24500 [Streptomyces parvus]|uniref:Uncharacterized protein n=1 Tax=Streptomyces parvus TaxID=66428 RepID=A0A5D4ITB7_9ACTN|nr:hypothetical protein FY004_24500 [Streptomyces parvus]
MKPSFMGVVLMSDGAVATAAGAAMYVLPGPGLPVVVGGLTALGVGAAVRVAGGPEGRSARRPG